MARLARVVIKEWLEEYNTIRPDWQSSRSMRILIGSNQVATMPNPDSIQAIVVLLMLILAIGWPIMGVAQSNADAPSVTRQGWPAVVLRTEKAAKPVHLVPNRLA